MQNGDTFIWRIVCLAVLGLILIGTPAATRAQGPAKWPIYFPLAQRAFVGEFIHPATAVPRPTATRTPPWTTTPTSTATPKDSPTPRASSTPTPVPPPTVTPTPEGPQWLNYVNYYRGLAKLPAVTENTIWGRGDQLHSKYMAKNDVIGHSEDSRKPFYTAEGNEAAREGNVAIDSQPDRPVTSPIDLWMTGPFHMLAIINPLLTVSAFGDATDSAGGVQYAATLDVHRGVVAEVPDGIKFPVRYPESNAILPNLSFEGYESPDPLVACTGYKAPTGAPLAIQFGPGDAKPSISKTSIRDEIGTELAHCWFDESKYPSGVGQLVLQSQSAVILMARNPYKPGKRYTVTVVNKNQTISWTFRTRE